MSVTFRYLLQSSTPSVQPTCPVPDVTHHSVPLPTVMACGSLVFILFATFASPTVFEPKDPPYRCGPFIGCAVTFLGVVWWIGLWLVQWNGRWKLLWGGSPTLKLTTEANQFRRQILLNMNAFWLWGESGTAIRKTVADYIQNCGYIQCHNERLRMPSRLQHDVRWASGATLWGLAKRTTANRVKQCPRCTSPPF